MNMQTKKIIFCKRCLYTNLHPFSITFNEEGICSGCLIHEEKNNLDWKLRLQKLKKIVKSYKSKSRKNYDCIVPVTGANDSHFIVHIVKNILGMNPLLVNYNKYFNTPIGISNLANLRLKFDLDILFKNINMNSVKKITKFTLLEHQNIYWPILAGHTVFPLEVAVNYKIPLIIWGAHQGLEQVGMFSHEHEVEMSRRYRENHDLFGMEAQDLITIDSDLTEEDISQYVYPDDKSIDEIGIRGIYLGNYIRWDPTSQHQLMIKKYGYKSCQLPRTFDTYDHVDCYNYMNLHDILKLSKRGYSKITDHVCREIRHKRLTREQGIELVNFYEHRKPENLDKFCDWLEIDANSLALVLNKSKNKNYWIQEDINKFKFTGPSAHFKNTKNNEINNNIKDILDKEFIKNRNINLNKKNEEYILFGKGVGELYE